jgi:hypothetical protein
MDSNSVIVPQIRKRHIATVEEDAMETKKHVKITNNSEKDEPERDIDHQRQLQLYLAKLDEITKSKQHTNALQLEANAMELALKSWIVEGGQERVPVENSDLSVGVIKSVNRGTIHKNLLVTKVLEFFKQHLEETYHIPTETCHSLIEYIWHSRSASVVEKISFRRMKKQVTEQQMRQVFEFDQQENEENEH